MTDLELIRTALRNLTGRGGFTAAVASALYEEIGRLDEVRAQVKVSETLSASTVPHAETTTNK